MTAGLSKHSESELSSHGRGRRSVCPFAQGDGDIVFSLGMGSGRKFKLTSVLAFAPPML